MIDFRATIEKSVSSVCNLSPDGRRTEVTQEAISTMGLASRTNVTTMEQQPMVSKGNIGRRDDAQELTLNQQRSRGRPRDDT